MDWIDLLSNKTWAADESYVQTILDFAGSGQHSASAVTPEKPILETLCSIPGEYIEGTRQASLHGSVAVLPLRGGIYPRSNFMTDYYGATSLQSWMSDFKRLEAMADVSNIVICVDSPGGLVSLVSEAHNMIRQSPRAKSVITYTEGTNASAAYWISSAAGGGMYASPTSEVGSIGVVVTVMDVRKAYEKMGVKQIYIVSKNAPLKRGNIGDKAWESSIQQSIDDTELVFMSEIAKARDVSLKTVQSDFGRGATFVGKRAMDADMIDGVMSFDTFMKFISSKGD